MKNIKSLFKPLLKLLAFALVIFLYLILSFLIICMNFFSMPKSRGLLLHLVRLVGKSGIKILGMKVTINGESPSLNDHFFIVSNHLGYLDIFIIAKYFPAVFVTSVEMRETKFLGEVCYLGGCHFVERRSLKKLAKEIREIAETLKENMNVVLFPEAKSTNGEKVIDFKPSLFEAARRQNSVILPLCLNYRKLDGEALTVRNRDEVFWYGEMSFFPHFLNLLNKKSIEVELNILPTLDSRHFQNRNELAEKSYELISKRYININ